MKLFLKEGKMDKKEEFELEDIDTKSEAGMAVKDQGDVTETSKMASNDEVINIDKCENINEGKSD